MGTELEAELHSINFKAFDTSNAISAVAEPTLLEETVALCHHLESLLSRFVEGSDVWRINHSNGQPVEVSSHTAKVLACAERVRKKTDGAFNVAIGLVSGLWKPVSKYPRPPALSKTNRLAKRLSRFRITVDELLVCIGPKSEIDLGGIAKGYICDEAAAFLRDRGVKNALLNFGGNVVSIGQHPQKRSWKVGLQAPGSKREQGIFATLEIEDVSVVTSGVYERAFVFDGKVYHHILDPRTCRPAESELVSVSVIGEDSMLADALATAMLVMGREESMKIANQFSIKLVLQQNDGSLYYSPGLALETVHAANVNVALPIT